MMKRLVSALLLAFGCAVSSGTLAQAQPDAQPGQGSAATPAKSDAPAKKEATKQSKPSKAAKKSGKKGKKAKKSKK